MPNFIFHKKNSAIILLGFFLNFHLLFFPLYLYSFFLPSFTFLPQRIIFFLLTFFSHLPTCLCFSCQPIGVVILTSRNYLSPTLGVRWQCVPVTGRLQRSAPNSLHCSQTDCRLAAGLGQGQTITVEILSFVFAFQKIIALSLFHHHIRLSVSFLVKQLENWC